MVAAHGGQNLADRDITEYEWAMQYVDSNKKVVLLTARTKGRGQLIKDRPFSYGRILRLNYEDPDSENLVLLVECVVCLAGLAATQVSIRHFSKGVVRVGCYTRVR